MIRLIVLRHERVTRLHIATRQRLRRQRQRRNRRDKTFMPLRRQRSKRSSDRRHERRRSSWNDVRGRPNHDARKVKAGGRELIRRRAHVAITVAAFETTIFSSSTAGRTSNDRETTTTTTSGEPPTHRSESRRSSSNPRLSNLRGLRQRYSAIGTSTSSTPSTEVSDERPTPCAWTDPSTTSEDGRATTP